LSLDDSTTYFGQVKNGKPHGRGAQKNNSHGIWHISEGYYQEGGTIGKRRLITGASKSGVATVYTFDEFGEPIETKYTCTKATKSCELKVEEPEELEEPERPQDQQGIPEVYESEAEDASDVEGDN